MPKTLRRALLSLLLLFLPASSVWAAERVNVLAYVFPPFLNEDSQTGLTPDTIDALNRIQDEFHFTLRVTSPRRRYLDFTKGNSDIILFEMPEWEWATQEPAINFSATSTVFRSGEKFFTLKRDGIDQSYFDRIGDKIICAYLGYHYGFADYNSDPGYLREKFRISLVTSHDSCIDRVLVGGAEIGLAPEALLAVYKHTRPEIENLIISQKYDQIYKLKALVAGKSPISRERLETLLGSLAKDREFRNRLDAQGLLQHWVITN